MHNLKKLRKEKGLTQQYLAEKFNLSQQSIYKYENDLAEPDISTLKSMAGFFDTSIDYLVGASDIRTLYDRKSEGNLTPLELEYLSSYRKMGVEDRFLISQLVKRLSARMIS